MKPQLPLLLLLKLGLVTIALAGIFYGLKSAFGYWLLDAALAGLAFVGLVFIFRIVTLAQLRQLRTTGK